MYKNITWTDMKSNFFSLYTRKITSFRISQKAVVLVSAFVIAISEVILIYGIRNNEHFNLVENLRLLHLGMAVIIFFLTFFSFKSWSPLTGKIYYLILFLPLIFIGWFNQMAMATSPIPWKPFVGYTPIFFALAVLYSGSFLLNFFLILAFSAEVVVLWFYLEPYYSVNLLASGEPYSVLVFAFVSLCLLAFRYQDEQTYRRLMLQKARSEFIENLARTFLTMRDRANSPLQSLYLVAELLKRKKAADDDIINILETSVTQLNDLNKKLIRYESHVPWNTHKTLMTDDEIDAWMMELEEELGKMKRDQQGI